jgi:hypothetical protein
LAVERARLLNERNAYLLDKQNNDRQADAQRRSCVLLQQSLVEREQKLSQDRQLQSAEVGKLTNNLAALQSSLGKAAAERAAAERERDRMVGDLSRQAATMRAREEEWSWEHRAAQFKLSNTERERDAALKEADIARQQVQGAETACATVARSMARAAAVEQELLTAQIATLTQERNEALQRDKKQASGTANEDQEQMMEQATEALFSPCGSQVAQGRQTETNESRTEDCLEPTLELVTQPMESDVTAKKTIHPKKVGFQPSWRASVTCKQAGKGKRTAGGAKSLLLPSPTRPTRQRG